MPATPGKRQKPKVVKAAARKRGRRPTLVEVEPLFSTYGAAKPPGAYFDEAAAARAVKWIEGHLRHFKGRWAGRPFYLMGWQARLVRELFGWKRSDGTRLYRRAYVEAPRKSGKSSLASAIALYLAYGDAEAGPEVAFAAYDREQAGICFNGARYMLEQVPELYAQTEWVQDLTGPQAHPEQVLNRIAHLGVLGEVDFCEQAVRRGPRRPHGDLGACLGHRVVIVSWQATCKQDAVGAPGCGGYLGDGDQPALV